MLAAPLLFPPRPTFPSFCSGETVMWKAARRQATNVLMVATIRQLTDGPCHHAGAVLLAIVRVARLLLLLATIILLSFWPSSLPICVIFIAIKGLEHSQASALPVTATPILFLLRPCCLPTVVCLVAIELIALNHPRTAEVLLLLTPRRPVAQPSLAIEALRRAADPLVLAAPCLLSVRPPAGRT